MEQIGSSGASICFPQPTQHKAALQVETSPLPTCHLSLMLNISVCRPWQGHGGQRGALPAVVQRTDPQGTRICSKAERGQGFTLEPLSTLGNVSIAAEAPRVQPESHLL